MPFCRKCGSSVESDAVACPSCGAKVAVKTTAAPVTQSSSARPADISLPKVTVDAPKRNYSGLLCPKCGGHEIQTTVEVDTKTTGSGYSATQGCCGYMFLGPLGLLCGTCGSNQQTTTTNTTFYHCMNCGEKFRRPGDLRAEAEKKRKGATGGLVLCFVLAIMVFVMAIAMTDGSEGVGIGVALAIVMIVTAFITKAVIGSSADKLDEQAYSIEKRMNQFRK